MLDKEFYKNYYSYLLGEIDEAVSALERSEYQQAQSILTNAMEVCEEAYMKESGEDQ